MVLKKDWKSTTLVRNFTRDLSKIRQSKRVLIWFRRTEVESYGDESKKNVCRALWTNPNAKSESL